MAEHIELTDEERAILGVMFRNMKEFINLCDGYIDINGASFNIDDLMNLAYQLEVKWEYWW